MEIKQEKRSFSDVESESDSEPESTRLVDPSKIKKEKSLPSPASADDTGSEDQLENESDDEESTNPWSQKDDRRNLDAILDKMPLPAILEQRVKEYFKDFDNVKPLSKMRAKCVEIDLANPDEDTWIIQCPVNVDIHSTLLNKKLNMSVSRSKIKHCSVPLEAHVQSNSGEKPIGLMCGSRIKSFSPAGFIRIAEALPETPVAVEIPTASSDVVIPFPENIPQRHPLLGYDFQETMAIPELVQSRLSAARQQAARFYSKTAASNGVNKSKSKRIKKEPEMVTEASESESAAAIETFSPTKSKQRKQIKQENATVEVVSPSKKTKLEDGSVQKKSKQDKEKAAKTTIKKELPIEDDIAWLLNI